MTQAIIFWILAVVSVGSALAVILFRDILRAALFLILCFFTIAGIYVTLNADFLAAVQVLIYIGAIGILLIFAIMLTREARQGNPTGPFRLPALLIALLLLVGMVYAATRAHWNSANPPAGPTTKAIATAIFGNGGFILPLEIAAVLLLAAVLGAIVLAREK